MGKGFRINQSRGIKYLELLLPKKGICRGYFSTREGGISTNPYGSLNLGFHVGDDGDRVLTNRELFLRSVGVPPEMVVVPEQVHGSNIVNVCKTHGGKGVFQMNDAVRGADALITKEPGVVLAALYADCVPIYIVDLENKGIGLAHAGWRGTIQNIAGKMLNKMEVDFGTVGDDCIAYIGPSIGFCCYEVGSDTAQDFVSLFPYDDNIYKEKTKGKYYVNLKEANAKILVDSGIDSRRIFVCDLCTSCSEELFFSYRRDGGKTGRMAALLGLQ